MLSATVLLALMFLGHAPESWAESVADAASASKPTPAAKATTVKSASAGNKVKAAPAGNPAPAGCQAGAHCAANQPPANAQQQGASAPKASYLIAVEDPKVLLPVPLKPCAAIEKSEGETALIVGVSSALTLVLAPGVAGIPSVSVDGSQVPITAIAGKLTFDAKPTKEGNVEVAITFPGTKLACANPVKITMEALAEDCAGLRSILKTGQDAGGSAPDLKSMISELGAPEPLSLVAQGQKILVYSSVADPASKTNQTALSQLNNAIRLLGGTSNPEQKSGLAMELTVPHHAKADDFMNIGFNLFKVSMEFPGNLKINETKPVACREWLALLNDIERKAVGTTGESGVSRLYYLKAADKTAAAIQGASSVKAASAAPSQNAGKVQTTQSGENKTTGGSSGSGTGTNAAGSANGSSSSSDKTTTTPPSQDGGQSKTSSQPPPPTTDSSNNAVGVNNSAETAVSPPVTVQALEQDLLVFGGDDSKITEAKRVLAMLDLPRPEMIINAWVLQASTTDAEEIGRFDDIARRLVAQNNDALQQGIGRGWGAMHQSISQSNSQFFDEEFYRYLVYRYVGDVGGGSAISRRSVPGSGGAEYRSDDPSREKLGICAADKYCLGYTSLFSPLRPRLTDLLLAIIAARQPVAVTEAAVNAVEGGYVGCVGKQCEELRARLRIELKPDATGCGLSGCSSRKSKNIDGTPPGTSDSDTPVAAAPTDDKGAKEDAEEKSAANYAKRWSECGKRDLERLVNSAGADFLTRGAPPHLQLECFRSTVERLFGDPATPTSDSSKTSDAQALGRAALADFLFNYKMSQEYPHEFSPYELTQSADSLNTSLAPFIDAFTRDVAAFQDYLNNVVSMAVDCKPCGKATFTNSGLVSVRTVSMNPAEFSSTTQSFMDASTFPDLATLASNILGNQPGGGTGNNAPKAAGVLDNLSFNQAQVIMGALKSYQSSEAQIGRAIDLKVTPRALSGASSAEMDITLNADDSGTPSRYTGTTSQNLNLSRVATHDTTTHVRVDSLQLFEVSAVSAHLTLSKPPFPLILPGVELPYVGSLVGWPRKPAEEYHSSIAIMSAIVVPTAADLANGLEFVYDRLILGPKGTCRRPWEADGRPACRAGGATLESELEGPISAFHRAKRECIATGGLTAFPVISPMVASDSRQSSLGEAEPPCNQLTLSSLTPAL